MISRFLFILFIIPVLGFSQVSFEAVTDAQSLLQGSTFQLTFELKNAEGTSFRAPDFTPFLIVSGPSRSMRTSIINGTMSSSMGFVYVLSCNQVGSFTIPAASIVVNGKTLQTRPIVIKVVKATASPDKGTDVFIKAIAEKSEVYYGEQFSLIYKLYTRVNIQNIEYASKPALDAFQEESINLNNSQVQREIYEGREYITKILSKSVLFPVKIGSIIIEPQVYRIVRGDEDPWGMGMPTLFRSQIENITSNEIKLLVKELPQAKPEQFSGAVGEMFMQITPLNKTYTLNDAIHLVIQLQGDANFNMIKPDFLRLNSSFEISDSKSGDIITVTDEPRLTKTRKYDYLIVPKSTGEFVIKPGLLFFSPQWNAYVKLQDSFSIQIINGNVTLSEQGKKDIADIRRSIDLKYKAPRLIEDFRAWILICFPIGLLLFGLFGKHIKDYFQSGKNKDVISIHFSTDQDLSLEHIEQLLLQKVHSRYSLGKEKNTLLAVKHFLQQNKNKDERAEKFLHIVEQLESMKYSGTSSLEQLRQLNESIQLL